MSDAHPNQAWYWLIGTAVFFAVLWLLGDVILPFVMGAAIAYFLDPIADRLEAMGLSRTLATVLIMVAAVVLFILTLLLILPFVIQQLAALVNAVPEYLRSLRDFLQARVPDVFDTNSPARQSLEALATSLQSKTGAVVAGILTSATSILNLAVFFVIAPVVAFYLLLDWDRMVAVIDDLLPRSEAPVIRRLGREIDQVLAGFVRGQLSVCLILGVFYAIALSIVGLQYGAAIGLIAGILTFIPYVGSLSGAVMSLGVALFQYWPHQCLGPDGDAVACPFWDSPWMIGIVAAIFFGGQMVEGNILTPKLVGGSVGLHPVWLLFALSAFGTLFGFVGMLVAVPVAAIIGVLVRYAIEQYREGRFYGGGGGGGGGAAP